MKDLVLYHLQFTLQKDSTQPSLATATQGLTAHQAAWRPSPDRHSIWQIVRHLLNFHQFVIQVLDGWNPDQADIDEMARRAWQEGVGDDGAWEAHVLLLSELSQGLIARVSDATEEKLVSSYLGRRPFAAQLQLLATHAMYHAGQIRYLRALLGV
ncbi:MAG TPA: DinB family protein [bacterium]|nr:DinB family protein [bacterium]